jgi:hypothetical protein
VIRSWVEAGGSLVAAYQSSLLDENGVARPTFGLADVFGVDLISPTRGPVKNNYMAMMEAHELHAGLEGAHRIIGGTHLLEIAPWNGVSVPFRFIPDFPDLPMEEVYPRQGPAEPAVVARELPSGGRVVYVAFNIGSLFWETLQADHGRVIANAVRWALRDRPLVRVEGPGLVDIAVRRNDAAIAVSLVNLTNPMAMRGAIRETLPLPRQRIAVRVPKGVTSVRGRLLVAGHEMDVGVQNGIATSEVSEMGLLEVLHLTWA